MILDSFDHAEEDFAKRLLIEARNEADTILAAVERAPENPAWRVTTQRGTGCDCGGTRPVGQREAGRGFNCP